MSHPSPTLPLPQALAKKRPVTPRLTDYPALALAASDLQQAPRPLDVRSPEFCGVMATLETLNRLQLGSRNAHALGLLIQRGPMRATDLGGCLRVSSAGVSVILRKLEALALITTRRPAEDGDRREVIATATAGAHNVMASLVALTALGQASAALFRPRLKTSTPAQK